MVGHLPVVAIVDDEPHFRRALERLLINTGFEARQFESGDEFLQHLDGIDCAILDLHMAGMSGFDVQKALATRRAPIPFLVLTGNDTPGNRSRSLSEGARAYLTKPVDDEELLSALRLILPPAQ